MPAADTSLADALNNVGWALHLKGDDVAARVELARALVLAPEDPGDRTVGVWIHGRIRTNLAVVTGALGDAAAADAELRRIVAMESADRMNRTRALEHLGRLEESWGDFEAALARYEEALATGEAALRDAAPTPYNRAYLVGALSRLGFLRERLGRTASAREALDRALLTARELGTRQLIAQVLLDRGRLARESGDLDSAVASHEEAHALASSARLEPAEALSLAELGWDALARADVETALALFERALASGRSPGRPRPSRRCARGSRGPASASARGPRPPSRTTGRWTPSSRCASARWPRRAAWASGACARASSAARSPCATGCSSTPGPRSTRRGRSSSRSRPARARSWT